MKRHGHYCKVCGEYKANEKFSGKGHAAKLPPEEKAEQMALRRLESLPPRLSKADIAWLKNRVKDRRPAVRQMAEIIYAIRFQK